MLNKLVKKLLGQNTNGQKLPSHAFPGGYPLFYVNNHNDILCPDCANGHAEYDETIVNYDVHLEGDSLYCDHCGREIESAYGNPDND